MVSQPPTIPSTSSQNLSIPDIPSPYQSNVPNSPNSPIVISDSPSPNNHPEDPLRTIIDLEALENLVTSSKKIVVPKPKAKISKAYVGKYLLIFETEIHEWVNSLKLACLENLNPPASDSHWNQFRKWFKSESLKLKELIYEIAQQNFYNHLNIFKDQVLRHWEKKPLLLLKNAPWEDHQPSKCDEPSSDPLPQIMFQDKGKEVEETTES